MADGPPSPSLERLIADSGRQPGPLVREFTRVAAAVQLDQYQRKASDTSLITRSTDLEPYQRWGRVVARFSFTL